MEVRVWRIKRLTMETSIVLADRISPSQTALPNQSTLDGGNRECREDGKCGAQHVRRLIC